MAVSDRKLQSYLNQKQDKEFLKADEEGLFYKVTKKGKVSFVFRYTLNSIQKKLTIGNYPSISLKKAREKRDEYNNLVFNGIDPKTPQHMKALKLQSGITPAKGIELYLAAHPNFSKETVKHYNQAKSKVEQDLLSAIEKIPKAQWRIYFNAFELPTVAHTHFKKLRAAIRWLMEQDIIEGSSIFDIPAKSVGQPPKDGQRVVSITEANTWLTCLPMVTGGPKAKLTLLWCLLTACRQCEARKMSWSQLDLKEKVWTLPDYQSKTGRIIRRAITPTMEIVLDVIATHTDRTGLVFSESDNMVGHSTLKELNDRIKEKMTLILGEIEDFTPHDFRRGLSTGLSDAEVEVYVTEKILGHVLEGTLAVYNKSDWLKQQHKAYQLWHELILPANFKVFLQTSKKSY